MSYGALGGFTYLGTGVVSSFFRLLEPELFAERLSSYTSFDGLTNRDILGSRVLSLCRLERKWGKNRLPSGFCW